MCETDTKGNIIVDSQQLKFMSGSQKLQALTALKDN